MRSHVPVHSGGTISLGRSHGRIVVFLPTPLQWSDDEGHMKNIKVTLYRSVLLSTAAFTLAWGNQALAQADQDPIPTVKIDNEVEAITIVGSQIKGARITGALPVSVVGT